MKNSNKLTVGRAAAINHWATALKHNGGIQRASGDGSLPSGQIFDTQSRALVELLGVFFATSWLVICDRSQIRIMSTTSTRQAAVDKTQLLQSALFPPNTFKLFYKRQYW